MNIATHPVAPEEIMALLDGELSTDRAQAVSSHVEQCADCGTFAKELQTSSRNLAQWQVGSLPSSIDESLKTFTMNPSATYGNSSSNISYRSGLWTWKQWIVGLGTAGTTLLLLFVITVPNLLRSRMAANEASAVGSLRTLNTAAVTYSTTYGHYPPSLESFGPPSSGKANEQAADLVDPVLAGGRKSGYLFTYQTVPAWGRNSRGGYSINADPVEPGSSGHRHFSTDQTGVIRANGSEILGGSLSEKLQEQDRSASGKQETARPFAEGAPLIARTADLKLEVEKLDEAREGMDRILKLHEGYVAQLSANTESGTARILIASLRVPANQLDVCIAELKKLGRVTQESQKGEEITQQHADLIARLKNSHNTEVRLNDVLQHHGGATKDILEVERESARVRGEIEQMEAEQQTLEHRVNFATIDLKVAEEYKAQLSSPAPSVGMQLRNATVNGFRSASESLLGIVLFFAESGPTLVLWLAILFFPAWMLWRRYRRIQALGTSLGA
jgi:type IV pilus assembly protein PilA